MPEMCKALTTDFTVGSKEFQFVEGFVLLS